VLRWYSWFHN